MTAAVGLQPALAEQLPPAVAVRCFSSVAEQAFAVLGQLVHLPETVLGRNGLPCWAAFRLKLPEAFSAAPVSSATDSRGCRFFKYLVRCSATCGGSSSENHSGIGSGAAVSIEISCGFTGRNDGLTGSGCGAAVVSAAGFPDTAEPALTFPFLCLLAVNRPAFFPPLSSAGALPL